uniref:Novel protein n=1 Tax=Xenopus tropicalis TaxID=8364 RepID=Q28G92_XENTR|nr:novel protein [Xenopus tropicalis]
MPLDCKLLQIGPSLPSAIVLHYEKSWSFIYVYVYMYIYICIYICMYVYIYIYMYITMLFILNFSKAWLINTVCHEAL